MNSDFTSVRPRGWRRSPSRRRPSVRIPLPWGARKASYRSRYPAGHPSQGAGSQPSARADGFHPIWGLRKPKLPAFLSTWVRVPAAALRQSADIVAAAYHALKLPLWRTLDSRAQCQEISWPPPPYISSLAGVSSRWPRGASPPRRIQGTHANKAWCATPRCLPRAWIQASRSSIAAEGAPRFSRRPVPRARPWRVGSLARGCMPSAGLLRRLLSSRPDKPPGLAPLPEMVADLLEAVLEPRWVHPMTSSRMCPIRAASSNTTLRSFGRQPLPYTDLGRRRTPGF